MLIFTAVSISCQFLVHSFLVAFRGIEFFFENRVVLGVGTGEIPEWVSPVLSCGCTRGACTSDSECVNRALCVQCPSACAAPLCANKVSSFKNWSTLM